MNVISTVTDWQFMNEPMSKWFIFFGAIMLISWAWKGILGFID